LEYEITPLILKWFEDNYPKSVALEIKIKGNKLLPHQVAALKKVWLGCFSYKIPDMGRQNPFDAFVLKKADAFVVVCDGHKCHASGSVDFDFVI